MMTITQREKQTIKFSDHTQKQRIFFQQLVSRIAYSVSSPGVFIAHGFCHKVEKFARFLAACPIKSLLTQVCQ
jgi:hypothetical protein